MPSPFATLAHSLRGRLLLLTAAIVLPTIVLAGYIIVGAHQDERAGLDRRLQDTARALTLALDRQLGQTEAILKTLALSPALTDGDYSRFKAEATAAIPYEGAWIVALAPDCRQVINTRLPPEAPLPAPDCSEEMKQSLIQGETYISNLVSSISVPGQMAVMIAVPVHGTREIAVLMMLLPAETLSSLFADQGIHGERGWISAIMDRKGVVIARNRRGVNFVGRTATEQSRTAISQSESGIFHSVTLDGVPSLAAFNRSQHSGWTIILGVPEAQLYTSTIQLLTTLGAATLGLVLLGILLSAWIGRGIVRSMATLVANAEAVGRGEIPLPPTAGMEETNLVAQALHDAAVRLKVREEELLRLNETLEARIQEASERLVAAKKLEAVGRLTGGVAHDFNNLLAAIRINLDLACRHVSNERAIRFIDAARDSTERGAKLVSQLIAFARKQRLEPEPVDVNATVASMAQMLRSTISGTIEIRTDLMPHLPLALADRTQLELIIMNLAINARDAIAEKSGVIALTTRQAEVGHTAGRPEAPAPGTYVVLSVTDNGSGMDQEALARVFEPFYTTKEVGHGSGLGLPQVLGIVKQLGGGIHIDSKPGAGTQVDVFLPLAPTGAVPAAAEPSTPRRANLAGLKVLLVDDDASVRTAVAALLTSAGCEVLSADGGSAALRLLEQGKAPSVALIDYAMPGMTGTELAARLKESHPNIAIVLMSGYAETDALTQRWSGPFLHKPFQENVLYATLAQAATSASSIGWRPAF